MHFYLPRILVLAFSLTIAFHMLVLVGVVPIDIVWGGKFESAEQVQIAELVSIVLNVYFLLISLSEAGFIDLLRNGLLRKINLGLMGIVFSLNTIGNLFAENLWETLLFTPVTGFLAFSAWWLLLKHKI